MWLLFEIGVLCSSLITKRGDHADDQPEQDKQDQPPATQP